MSVIGLWYIKWQIQVLELCSNTICWKDCPISHWTVLLPLSEIIWSYSCMWRFISRLSFSFIPLPLNLEFVTYWVNSCSLLNFSQDISSQYIVKFHEGRNFCFIAYIYNPSIRAMNKYLITNNDHHHYMNGQSSKKIIVRLICIRRLLWVKLYI